MFGPILPEPSDACCMCLTLRLSLRGNADTIGIGWNICRTTSGLWVNWHRALPSQVDKWVKLRLARLKTRSVSMRRDAATAETLESADTRVALGSDEAYPLNKR
eukprot:363235-Chlamydomonas_euryale.AAC.8